MKKLMFVVGLCLLTSSLFAACFGPFCYDDTGATIAGFAYNGNGQALAIVSSTTIAGLTPYVGQEVWCNTCVNFNNSKGMLCVSTGTAVGAFVAISSATTLTACK